MNFSVTLTGVIIAVVVPVLIKFGFSESCSNELVNTVIPLVGGAIAWFGRTRKGDITPLGFRK